MQKKLAKPERDFSSHYGKTMEEQINRMAEQLRWFNDAYTKTVGALQTGLQNVFDRLQKLEERVKALEDKNTINAQRIDAHDFQALEDEAQRKFMKGMRLDGMKLIE